MNLFERILIELYSKIKYRKTCKIEGDAIVYGKCFFEGKNKISPGAHVTNSTMGYATYIGKDSVFSHAVIGRFCSIADNVKLVRARHPIEGFVSIHPSFYSTSVLSSMVKHNKYNEYIEDQKGASLIIGNDVWIGCNVLIKAGIRIGNGAVIAMGSVVTNDVPDFAIAGGVPAKIIKYRFSEENRRKIAETRWWEKDLDFIKKNADSFEKIDSFLSIFHN